jgi:hypothetical protein
MKCWSAKCSSLPSALLGKVKMPYRAVTYHNKQEVEGISTQSTGIYYICFAADSLTDNDDFNLLTQEGNNFATQGGPSAVPTFVVAPTGNGKTQWILPLLSLRCDLLKSATMTKPTLLLFIVHAQRLASKVVFELKAEMPRSIICNYQNNDDRKYLQSLNTKNNKNNNNKPIILVLHPFSAHKFKDLIDGMTIDLVVIDEVEELRKQLLSWGGGGGGVEAEVTKEKKNHRPENHHPRRPKGGICIRVVEFPGQESITPDHTQCR